MFWNILQCWHCHIWLYTSMILVGFISFFYILTFIISQATTSTASTTSIMDVCMSSLITMTVPVPPQNLKPNIEEEQQYCNPDYYTLPTLVGRNSIPIDVQPLPVLSECNDSKVHNESNACRLYIKHIHNRLTSKIDVGNKHKPQLKYATSVYM